MPACDTLWAKVFDIFYGKERGLIIDIGGLFAAVAGNRRIGNQKSFGFQRVWVIAKPGKLAKKILLRFW